MLKLLLLNERARLAIHLGLVASICLFFFLKVDPSSISVEKNIYDYYSESITTDFDLNVINQVPVKERWQITKSGNYPDVHSNGIVSFWYPFFIFKQSITQNFGTSLDQLLGIFVARSFATVFFGCLSLIFLYRISHNISQIDSDFKVHNFSTIFFFLGVSFFWYLLYQPGNADVTSLFWGTMELLFFQELLKKRNTIQFLFFGLMLGIGLSLKVDHFFYLLLPLCLFIKDYQNSLSHKKIFSRLIVFCLGYGVILALILLNDFIKYGFLGYGYADVVSFEYYLIWENLFYPSGFINNNPIYLFSLFGLLIYSLKKDKKIELVFIGLVPLFSLSIESMARLHQESYGGRHWIAYLPSFFVFYTYFINYSKKWLNKAWKQSFFYMTIFLCIIQNFIKLNFYLLSYDKFYFGVSQYYDLGNFLQQLGIKEILAKIVFLPSLTFKFDYFLVLVLICLLFLVIAYFFVVIKKQSLSFFLNKLVLYFVCIYFIVTGLNIANNENNYLIFKETGALKRAIVGNGPHIYALYENLGTTERAIRFYEINNSEEKVAFFTKVRKEYISLASKEILIDPIGFKEKLLSSSREFINNEIRID